MGQFRVLIIDGSDHQYNSNTIDLKPTGGIPLITTRLAEALAKAGCDITVRNNTPENTTAKGVRWENRAAPYNGARPDIILANNDVNIFNEYETLIAAGAVPVLWLRNLFTWKRLIKKKRVKALLKWRPAAVFLGEYHKAACSAFMPFRSKHVIPHAVDDNFFNFPVENKKEPQAIFLSKAFRGFKEVVDGWTNHIHPACPDARLKAFVGADEIKDIGYSMQELEEANIIITGRVPRSQLMQDMAISSCLLYPGHKDETFCNAAAESTVMGLPIISRGIGSLGERTKQSGGILAHSDQEFIQAAISLLTDKERQQTLSDRALQSRDDYRWEGRIELWLRLFEGLCPAEQQKR